MIKKMLCSALSAAVRLCPGAYRARLRLSQSRVKHVVHPDIVLSKSETGSTHNLRRNAATCGVCAEQAWWLYVFDFTNDRSAGIRLLGLTCSLEKQPN